MHKGFLCLFIMNTLESCFICERSLANEETVNVTKKGLNSFREASLKREDRKDSLLTDLETIVVHRKCQKSYVNPKLIESFKRKNSNFPVIPQRESRSATQILSFQNSCFLCAKVITEDFLKNEARKRHEQRDRVVEVTQLNIRNEVLYLAKRINNEWSDGIVNRLNPVRDLVAEEAKYHNSCMKKLNILAMKAAEADGAPKQKRGRSVDQVEKAMSYIFNYLDENSSE